MSKYIDADLLRKEVKRSEKTAHKSALGCADSGIRRFHEGKDFAYQHVGILIGSLQQEQQEVDLEKEIERVVENYNSLANGSKVMKPSGVEKIARHFYELGKQSKGPVSEDLEEAAEEYADKHGFRVPYDGSINYYDDVDVKASKEGFIAGAEWQARQLLKSYPLPEDTVIFQKGVEEGRRLEREESHENYVRGYANGYKDAEKQYNESVAYHFPIMPTPPSGWGCDGTHCTNPHGDCINCPKRFTTGGTITTPNTLSGTSTATLYGNTSATDGKEHNPSFID